MQRSKKSRLDFRYISMLSHIFKSLQQHIDIITHKVPITDKVEIKNMGRFYSIALNLLKPFMKEKFRNKIICNLK